MPAALLAEVVVKSAPATVTPGEDDSSPNGTFEVVLSTPAKDRDGEEVKSDEWDLPLPEHITFDVDHGMSVASTVGSGVPRLDDAGRLIVSGTYASTPLAQATRSLVKERHIRTTSVAFLRTASTDSKGGKRITRELINGAFVAVPANREALVLDSKAIAAIKLGARNAAADQQHIQDAHDHMAAAGAACGKSKAVDMTADDPATTPESAALAVDAAISAAVDAFAALDPASLPEDVQQAVALVLAADLASDELLAAMRIPDPDQSSEGAEAAAPDTTQHAASSAAAAEAAAAEHAASMREVHAAALRRIHDFT